MVFIDSPPHGRLHYRDTGTGQPALLFIHGWLGSSAWWADQEAFFAPRHRVLSIDLPGHGQSSPFAGAWSAEGYAAAIRAVVDASGAQQVVLVAHSMAGAYALLAANAPQVTALVLVDTLKNLDQLMTHENADRFMLQPYRRDFKAAVETLLPPHLYAPGTPPAVRARLQDEFLQADGGRAADIVEPLFRMDVRAAAKQVTVPVRAINRTSSSATWTAWAYHTSSPTQPRRCMYSTGRTPWRCNANRSSSKVSSIPSSMLS